MALNISIDAYEFSTGMEFSQKVATSIPVAQITGVVPASIYNFKNEYFTGVRSKITKNDAGVLKDYYAFQTVAAIQALINA